MLSAALIALPVVVLAVVAAVIVAFAESLSVSLDEEAGQSFNPYAAVPGEEYADGEEAHEAQG